MAAISHASRPHVRRPIAPVWLPAGAALTTASVVVAGIAIVGYLVVGVLSGPVSWWKFFTSSDWDPTRGQFGAAPMIWGTIAVAAIALVIAAPIGWGAAIAIHETLPRALRRSMRTAAEILAVVPSVVYGLLGILYVRPFVARTFHVSGGDGLLAAALVLALMVLPTIVAVSVDALAAVPDSAREAARSLGLRRSEVIRRAVLPLSRKGLVAAALLALARALGETVAVFLLVGRADGHLPDSITSGFTAIVHPGQTLSTKLNSPETIQAGTSGAHWASLCALGLVLLGLVAVLTFLGQRSMRSKTAIRHWRAHATPRSVAHGRLAKERMTTCLVTGAVVVPFLAVICIAVALLAHGYAGLNPTFWWRETVGGSGGGVRNQIVGTLLLVVGAGVLACPIGAGLGLAISEYSSAHRAKLTRSLVLTLGGVPSIVLGLAGYWLLSTKLGWGKSWLAGVLVLAVIAIPITAVTIASAIDALPQARRETANALGLTRTQVVRSVVLPHAAPALITGLFLGLARAAGETAPLLFTTTVFSGASTLPHGVRQAPVMALTTHIFDLTQDTAAASAARAAWGSALVLVAIAGILLLIANLTRRQPQARHP